MHFFAGLFPQEARGLFPEFGELEGGKLPRAEEQTNVVVPERGFLGGYYVLEGSVHIILFLEH